MIDESPQGSVFTAESNGDDDGILDVDDAPKTVEQRLADLEGQGRNQLASFKRTERDLWIGIAGVAGAVIVCMIAIVASSNNRNVSTRDDNLDDLLTEGVHCYNSPEEMAAARQRALSAIDRINWDRNHPTPATVESHPDPMLSNEFGGTPPATTPHKSISVVKGTYSGLKRLDDTVDVDDNLCFGIQISSR